MFLEGLKMGVGWGGGVRLLLLGEMAHLLMLWTPSSSGPAILGIVLVKVLTEFVRRA